MTCPLGHEFSEMMNREANNMKNRIEPIEMCFFCKHYGIVMFADKKCSINICEFCRCQFRLMSWSNLLSVLRSIIISYIYLKRNAHWVTAVFPDHLENNDLPSWIRKQKDFQEKNKIPPTSYIKKKDTLQDLCREWFRKNYRNIFKSKLKYAC